MTEAELTTIEAWFAELKEMGVGAEDGMVKVHYYTLEGLCTALRAAWARVAELEAQIPTPTLGGPFVPTGQTWCGLCGTYVQDMDHHHIGGQSRGGVT